MKKGKRGAKDFEKQIQHRGVKDVQKKIITWFLGEGFNREGRRKGVGRVLEEIRRRLVDAMV